MTRPDREFSGLELGLAEYKNRKIDWNVIIFGSYNLFLLCRRHMKRTKL